MTKGETKGKQKEKEGIGPTPLEDVLICQENIKRLKTELAEWEGKKDGLLATIITPSLKFEQTKMQVAKGGKSDTYKEGNLHLVRTRTEKRKLDQDAIRKTFPDLVAANGEVSLHWADKLLGSETVAKFATTEVSMRYEVRRVKQQIEKE